MFDQSILQKVVLVAPNIAHTEGLHSESLATFSKQSPCSLMHQTPLSTNNAQMSVPGRAQTLSLRIVELFLDRVLAIYAMKEWDSVR